MDDAIIWFNVKQKTLTFYKLTMGIQQMKENYYYVQLENNESLHMFAKNEEEIEAVLAKSDQHKNLGKPKSITMLGMSRREYAKHASK